MSEIKRTDEIQGDIVHEYDGIEEADNRLPTWWLITFYGAIVFAIGYFFVYHVYSMAPSTPEVYAAEVAERAGQGGPLDETTLVTLAQDSGTVQQGREAFAANCVPCHGDRAQGVIAPNLTDGAWIHGGAAMQIYQTVHEGVPGKMPAWGATLGERPVRALVAYILTLRDYNEAGGRPPEGQPYEPGEATEPAHAAAQPASPSGV